MQPFADYHTHTKYSHGTGTVEDNVRAAWKKGLKEVGIADHGPGSLLMGVKSSQTLLEIKELTRKCQEKYPEICVKAGVEANIIDLSGELDVLPKVQKELDLVLAGFHLQLLPSSLECAKSIVWDNVWTKLFKKGQASQRIRNNNTKAVVEAVQKNKIDILTHPGLNISIDTPEIARACAQRNTAMEINSHHGQKIKGFVAAAVKEGASFVISSDAHTPAQVGDLSVGIELAQELRVPPELILNIEK